MRLCGFSNFNFFGALNIFWWAKSLQSAQSVTDFEEDKNLNKSCNLKGIFLKDFQYEGYTLCTLFFVTLNVNLSYFLLWKRWNLIKFSNFYEISQPDKFLWLYTCKSNHFIIVCNLNYLFRYHQVANHIGYVVEWFKTVQVADKITESHVHFLSTFLVLFETL